MFQSMKASEQTWVKVNLKSQFFSIIHHHPRKKGKGVAKLISCESLMELNE